MDELLNIEPSLTMPIIEPAALQPSIYDILNSMPPAEYADEAMSMIFEHIKEFEEYKKTVISLIRSL